MVVGWAAEWLPFQYLCLYTHVVSNTEARISNTAIKETTWTVLCECVRVCEKRGETTVSSMCARGEEG